MKQSFITTSSFGIDGEQYYWTHAEGYGITEDELRAIGINGDDAVVHEELKEPLIAADKRFRQDGFRLYIKDAYRSNELYDLVYQKRVEKFGEHDTNRSLNIKRRPHASGFAVDIALIDVDTGEEWELRDKKDGVDSYFIGFYEEKSDPKSQEYVKWQGYVREVMLGLGWQLGKLNEIWHFEWPHADLPE